MTKDKSYMVDTSGPVGAAIGAHAATTQLIKKFNLDEHAIANYLIDMAEQLGLSPAETLAWFRRQLVGLVDSFLDQTEVRVWFKVNHEFSYVSCGSSRQASDLLSEQFVRDSFVYKKEEEHRARVEGGMLVIKGQKKLITGIRPSQWNTAIVSCVVKDTGGEIFYDVYTAIPFGTGVTPPPEVLDQDMRAFFHR